MEDDEYLMLLVRSSMGFKYNVRLVTSWNCDLDYYNNPVMKDICLLKFKMKIKEVLKINKGDRFAQGIFNKFYLVDDDCADKDRTGGFGSTGKGE